MWKAMEQLDTFQALRKHKMELFTKEKFQSRMAVETSGAETALMLG